MPTENTPPKAAGTSADRNTKFIYSEVIDSLERLGKLADNSFEARCNKETL
jgi:hypothetical protein